MCHEKAFQRIAAILGVIALLQCVNLPHINLFKYQWVKAEGLQEESIIKWIASGVGDETHQSVSGSVYEPAVRLQMFNETGITQQIHLARDSSSAMMALNRWNWRI